MRDLEDRAPRCHRRRHLLVLAAAVLAAGSTGCTTSISARHTPLYRATAHTATIQVQAGNDEAGIERIEIEITRGAMTDCSELGGPPSVIPCRSGAMSDVYVCNYGSTPASATCTTNLNVADGELITYRAVATPGNGTTRSTQPITFAAGEPPTEFIARPMWWHRSEVMGTKIDLGFFPDNDYGGDYEDFTDDLEAIATGAFFNPAQQFAKLYTLFRGVHNLWAGPFGVNVSEDSASSTDEVAPVGAAMDGSAILHQNEFRDWGSISLGGGGAGTVWVGADNPSGVLIHETGHFLHGQGDEYCCDGGYFTDGACSNVFDSLADCQGYASAQGFDSDDCLEIVGGGGAFHTDAWRVDDGQVEIMREVGVASDWRNTSRQCVQSRYAACSDGSCY